jgi:hypothetical protein
MIVASQTAALSPSAKEIRQTATRCSSRCLLVGHSEDSRRKRANLASVSLKLSKVHPWSGRIVRDESGSEAAYSLLNSSGAPSFEA